MKLHILSDLHLEFGEASIPDVEADLVLLAGDIDRKLRGLEWALSVFTVPVLYVLGNHEYYTSSTPRLTVQAQQTAARTNGQLAVLERSSVTVGDVVFLGATLWTDFALHGDDRMGRAAAAETMNDYRRIRVDPQYRRLRPADVAAIHQRSRTWLEEQLAIHRGMRVVVVTHHAPSAHSIAPSLINDPISAAYASHLDDLVRDSGAVLWVHGHTHHAVDYEIGPTRVLSNPRGYPDEPVPGFRPDLVVDV